MTNRKKKEDRDTDRQKKKEKLIQKRNDRQINRKKIQKDNKLGTEGSQANSNELMLN